VAALSPGAQGKLLRILQERTFERLGGTETLRIEARLIALTNVDLPAAVKSGSFREIFFSAQRSHSRGSTSSRTHADILPLADHLLATLKAIHARPNAQLSDAARRMLVATPGPAYPRTPQRA